MDTIEVPGLARKVLIIDDRYDAILPIRVLLKRDGHEIFEAHSGEEGVELATKAQPDVVLCDIGLPGKWDGYDVVRELRARIETQAAYMIAVSGYCQPSDVARSQHAGFDDHFPKPVDLVKLRQLVAQHPLRTLLQSVFALDAADAEQTCDQ
jgi:CheY-like chemotaxis protein